MNVSLGYDAARARLSRRSAALGSLALLAGTGMCLGEDPVVGGAEQPGSERERKRRQPDRSPAPTHADLPYVAGGTPAQVLDLYLPAAPAATPFPLVIWIHGGGWVGGSKNKVGVPYLVGDGFAIASIDYRLLGDAGPPAQIQDANAAIAFLWTEADRYGLDRDRFVLGGASAGGFSTIVAGLSANDGVAEFETDPDVRLAALIDFFGTATTDTWSPNHELQEFPVLTEAEREQMYALLDPLRYVDAGDPPVLIIHGALDGTVPIEGSDLLAAELEAAGVPVTYERYPDRGHGLGKFQDERTRTAVRTFLAEALSASS